jgi:hypothetical protein
VNLRKARVIRADLGTKSMTSDFTHEAAFIWSNRQSPRSDWRATMPTNLQENLARHLCDSIDRLHKQVEQVEFWASAVSGLSQPVPEYEPETSSIARYLKPGRLPRKRHRRRSPKGGETKAKPASA